MQLLISIHLHLPIPWYPNLSVRATSLQALDIARGWSTHRLGRPTAAYQVRVLLITTAISLNPSHLIFLLNTLT